MSQFQPQTSAIANGADVVLGGLNKAVLNGATGQVLGIDKASGRYKIQLVGESTEIHSAPILIKRENLQVIPKPPGISFTATPADKTQVGLKHPSSWADGLGALAAAEWFVDCYRMRLDDDYVHGGGNLHGLYSGNESTAEIVFDFLEFCLLAVATEVVSESFCWSICINNFGYLLRYAFEKSDAQEKYGRENFFSAIMGGRSLRFTATQVYGVGVEYGSQPEAGSEQRHAKIRKQIKPLTKCQSNFERAATAIESHPIIFEKVGGGELWKSLLLKLETQPVR